MVCANSNSFQTPLLASSERETSHIKAYLHQYLWHLAQQVKRFTIGFVQVNLQTMERNDGAIGEAAATLRGDDFDLATNIIFSKRHDFLSEAGGFGHEHPPFPASTS